MVNNKIVIPSTPTILINGVNDEFPDILSGNNPQHPRNTIAITIRKIGPNKVLPDKY